jgi:hypothetical protein
VGLEIADANADEGWIKYNTGLINGPGFTKSEVMKAASDFDAGICASEL